MGGHKKHAPCTYSAIKPITLFYSKDNKRNGYPTSINLIIIHLGGFEYNLIVTCYNLYLSVMNGENDCKAISFFSASHAVQND